MGACGITPGTISTYGLFIDAVFGTSLNFIGGGHFNGIPRCSSGIIGGGILGTVANSFSGNGGGLTTNYSFLITVIFLSLTTVLFLGLTNVDFLVLIYGGHFKGTPLCSSGIIGGGIFGTKAFNFSGNGGGFRTNSCLTTVLFLGLTTVAFLVLFLSLQELLSLSSWWCFITF